MTLPNKLQQYRRLNKYSQENNSPEVTKVDLNPKRKSKLKLIVSIWEIILCVLLVISIFSKGINGLVAWYIFFLAILITIILTLIYFLVLLAKALNKYIKS